MTKIPGTNKPLKQTMNDLNDNSVQACLGKGSSYLLNEEILVNTTSGIELTENDFYQLKNDQE